MDEWFGFLAYQLVTVNTTFVYLPLMSVPVNFHRNFLLVKEMSRMICCNNLNIWLRQQRE